MKIAVIGGAGVRTPLLVSGLTGSDLPIDEIALFDVDQRRLPIITGVATRMCAGARLTQSRSVAECVASADFVFTSVRVGGLERRIADETVAQRHGIAGQETVGPAGFAMATRTIPELVRYAREIADLAPSAWIINFTNPVGMVTEALRTETDRVVGICDTPTELFEAAAHALDLDPAACSFDYFGLNHLGWLREIYAGGEPQLQRLWDDDVRLQTIYRMPLFDCASLRKMKLLPTEYVYYYDQPTRAFDNIRRAGHTRGRAIAELTAALFDSLADSRVDAVAAYTAYLRTRSAGYMQIETAADRTTPPGWTPELSGYDKIALAVVSSIHRNANDVIPLSVRNDGNIPVLRDDDVVEVPCVVNANGARPMHVGRVPETVRPLLERVKHYERLTVRAALAQSPALALEALTANPLVPTEEAASALIADLQPLW